MAHYTTEVARTGQTKVELRAAQRALIQATARRDNLLLSNDAVTGSDAYLAKVDADQVDSQIATLAARIAEVTAHRAGRIASYPPSATQQAANIRQPVIVCSPASTGRTSTGSLALAAHLIYLFDL